MSESAGRPSRIRGCGGHDEDQGFVRPNSRSRGVRPVGQRSWDHQKACSTDLHAGKPLGPSGNHLVQCETRLLSARPRGVEDIVRHHADSAVVDGNHVSGRDRSPVTVREVQGIQFCDVSCIRCNNHARSLRAVEQNGDLVQRWTARNGIHGGCRNHLGAIGLEPRS